MAEQRPDVLIVGAGPTGLVLALRLARHGIRFRIIDRAEGPGRASRAMAVQARTLEFYQQLGLADAAIALGVRMERMHLREGGEELLVLPLREVGEGTSPYPFVLCLPQDDHERFLTERLAGAGVTVEWGTELRELEQHDGGVRAVLHGRDGEETCEASYVCGCDGAHTAVRRLLGIGFPGGTYAQSFYVADVAVRGMGQVTGDGYMHFGTHSLALMLPVRSSGLQRLIGIVPPEFGDREHVTFENVRPSAEATLGIQVAEVNWFSTYRVHHRVADHFRSGRAFIAGDAGHLHSPAGGQGMNTGIGDAVNLSWKLAHVVQGRVSPMALDTYETERIAFARKLVETTDRAFQGMVGEGWGSRFLRGWLLPHLAPMAAGIPAVRRAMFATLSQTRITYRSSALSEGRAGEVHGGDRLPWTGSNYASLNGTEWRLHAYGGARTETAEAATAYGVPVDAFAWDETAERAGFRRDACYLVRPDGHVALALPDGDPEGLRAYAARIGLAGRH